jgi:hypothetical protein
MKCTTIEDCSVLTLPKIHNLAGNITSINEFVEVPFGIKRVYYLYDVPGGESRGGHAHKALQQLIIAASGSFDVTIDDSYSKKTIQLNRPYFGLHLQQGIWRDISNFSSGAICLVLASELYYQDDYIRDYEEFIKFKKHDPSFS